MAVNHLNIGDMILFGRYPQNSADRSEPIAWRVLDTRDGRALLLSKYILDVKPFAGENGSVFWGYCFLRDWLEKEFRPRAFTPEENARIYQPEPWPEARWEMDELMWENFRMEDATECMHDAVFILSYNDILEYFPGENPMFCPGASAPGTTWVNAQADVTDLCWWLRTASAKAGYVHIVSPVNSVGACIDAKGTLHGVRPALWLRTDG